MIVSAQHEGRRALLQIEQEHDGPLTLRLITADGEERVFTDVLIRGTAEVFAKAMRE